MRRCIWVGEVFGVSEQYSKAIETNSATQIKQPEYMMRRSGNFAITESDRSQEPTHRYDQLESSSEIVVRHLHTLSLLLRHYLTRRTKNHGQAR